MATIQKRGKRYTCLVRYKKVTISQTFSSITAAREWGRDVESAVDNRTWPIRELIPPHLWEKWGLVEEVEEVVEIDDSKPHPGWTIDRAFSEYARTVTKLKKGWKQEGNRIAAWRKLEIAKRRLDDEELPQLLKAHIKMRMTIGSGRKGPDGKPKGVGANTIRNEIFLFSALYEHARLVGEGEFHVDGWGLTELVNPTTTGAFRLPAPPPARDRRLASASGKNKTGEEERLRAGFEQGPDADQMTTLFDLAIETGMRLGELLDVRISEIVTEGDARIIHRATSKNEQRRRVTLSTRASTAIDRVLDQMPDDVDENTKLIRLDVPAVEYRWRLARQHGKVKGLTWHDLRHEGLSRMATMGLNIGELRAQSGHKTVSILANYINAVPSEISKKLG